jgi:SAM-dependent methyltransferase
MLNRKIKMSQTVFSEYSDYYDLLYKDKDYSAEVEYIVALLQKYLPAAKRILEFGSGTGIHGKLLAQKGYSVFGIEQSAEMVAKAQVSAVHGFDCKVDDICKVKLEKKHDVVLALFHVLSYLTTNDRLLSVFKNAYNHLEKEGLFIFDVWYTPAVYMQFPEVRIKRMEDENYAVIRIAEPDILFNKNVVEVNYTVLVKNKKTNNNQFEFKENHPMRHYSIPEIELIAESTGFSLLKTEEFLTGSEVGPKTWGACFIYRKII